MPYEQQQGNVALRALLTDGSAFCAFLRTGGGIDNALVDVAVGARSTESETHLPLSVTTFNTIESVALLTLCPVYQKLLSAPDRSKIRALVARWRPVPAELGTAPAGSAGRGSRRPWPHAWALRLGDRLVASW